MSSLKKIDQITQYKLTNAIEKAASVAAASGKDPSSVLAGELDKAHLPNHLNKVATQAFNRRLSVMELSARTDQNKADSFPIADLSSVDKARGVVPIEKTAAVCDDGEFRIDFSKAVMKKSAKYEAPKAPKKQLTVGQFMHKIQSAIDHDTNVLREMHYQIVEQQTKLKELKKRAYEALQKNPKVCKQLTAKYGDAFTKVFNKLPEQNLQKFSAFVVLPASKEVKLAQDTIRASYSVMYKQADYIAASSWTKACLICAEQLQKRAKDMRCSGLVKQADGAYTVLKGAVANALGGAVNAAGSVTTNSLDKYLKDLDKYRQLGFNPFSADPVDALTATLVAQDKQDDQRMALAQVLADPANAKYPARQVQNRLRQATNQTDEFLNPRFTQQMKANVRDKLLAGGTSTAQMRATQTAMAQALRGLAQADAINPYTIVSLMPETKTKAAPDDLKLSEVLGIGNLKLHHFDTNNKPIEALLAMQKKDDEEHEKQKKELQAKVKEQLKKRKEQLKEYQKSYLQHQIYYHMIGNLAGLARKKPTSPAANTYDHILSNNLSMPDTIKYVKKTDRSAYNTAMQQALGDLRTKTTNYLSYGSEADKKEIMDNAKKYQASI